jgi:hypothetical protein
MQISRHNETQAHIYGTCGCDNQYPKTPTASEADYYGTPEDVDEDNGDEPMDRYSRPEQRPATRELSDAEVARRRRARRRF